MLLAMKTQKVIGTFPILTLRPTLPLSLLPPAAIPHIRWHLWNYRACMLKSYDIRVAHKPIGTLSIDDERDCSVKGLGRERRSRRENSRMSARLLWTTSFPCKCSKRLSTVCPKRSIARTLPGFLSSCSFFLFIFLYLAAGQLLLVKIKRAWTSSVSLQVIPVAFSSWRIFALCLHKSARPVCLSWIFYWLWILDDQGHSGLQVSGSMHLLFPCFYTKIGRVP